MTPERLQLVTFPAGTQIVPNPFNRIPDSWCRPAPLLRARLSADGAPDDRVGAGDVLSR